jgi:hypothetical protein
MDSLVVLSQFIQATRDAGYRGTAAAVAELVDNAFEADATTVRIAIGGDPVVVSVTDDGSGMARETMCVALQFGGSTRFNSRTGIGRYGMGLPNSSVSQARRVEVTSWQSGLAWTTYLDVDEIVAGALRAIPEPEARAAPDAASGTIVRWSRCDRLDSADPRMLEAILKPALGRIFRHQLWRGRRLFINDEGIMPLDPLFFREGQGLVGAQTFGPTLEFELREAPGRVRVTFSLLPITKWEGLSAAEKRSSGIAKSAGISIVRGGREIDTGWYFMGGKRKENYDDWWRCEVEFPPTLDELFGVTHTKQGIHPSQPLVNTLTPDMEGIAHQLNAIVRSTFTACRGASSTAASHARRCDFTIEPPRKVAYTKRNAPVAASGRTYRMEQRIIEDLSFFEPVISADEILVILNQEHPFFGRVYEPVQGCENEQTRAVKRHLDLLLFAAARAEASVRSNAEKHVARRLRESWSNALAAFLA